MKGKAANQLITRLTLTVVRAYQIFLGPFFGGGCKFYPSCSRYTYEAIQRFGTQRGLWFGLKRVLRCRPFSTGGYDPVPEDLPRNQPRATEQPTVAKAAGASN